MVLIQVPVPVSLFMISDVAVVLKCRACVMRVGNLKNGKSSGGDKITGEMTKGGGDRVVDWICILCNIAFESGVMP